MTITTQTTKPIVTFYRISNTGSKETYFVYNANIAANRRFHVTGYTFTETIKDFSGRFSVSIYENQDIFDINGVSAWSLIQPLDIVEIREGYKVFLGVIHSKNFKSTISGGSVKRQLEVSGMGIQNLFSSYNICLDAKAQTNVLTEISQKSLTEELAGKQSIKDVFMATWEHFEEISKSINDNEKPYISTAINAILGKEFLNISDNLETYYPIVCNFYDSNNNTFYAILKNILPSNAYEVYGEMIEDKPKITVRLKPFEKEDWGKLDCIILPTNRVLGYNVNVADTEVYSAYLAYIEGSLVSSNQMIQKELNEKSHGGMATDKEKLSKYGYRLLQTNFRGAKLETENQSLGLISDLSSMLKRWYSHTDEMLCGSVTLVTNTETNTQNQTDDSYKIKAGTKIRFNSLEFYVEEASHTWSFGEAPKTTLRLSRGGVYTGNQFDSKATLNCDITKRFAEL